jgi:hypothetical protein
MQGEKLLRVLQHLIASGHKPRGIFILGTGGGELRLSTSSQPQRTTHGWLLKHGFIPHDGDYIYRP